MALESKQPYQYHLDQMQREKNLEKSRKVIRQPLQSTAQPIVPSTQALHSVAKLAASDNPLRVGLRRSLTDSKIRTIPNPLPRPASICSVDGQELSDGLMLANIPRTSSPLKRYKVEAFKSTFPQNGHQPRQSVILTIDDKGRARTQVTTVGSTPGQSPIPEDDDDESSDDGEGSTLTMKAPSIVTHKPSVPPVNDRNDAQDALRQVVQERQRQKQSQVPQIVGQTKAKAQAQAQAQHVHQVQQAQNYPLVRSQSESAGHLMNFDNRKSMAFIPNNISVPSSIPAYPVNIDHLENISPNNISPNSISEPDVYTPNGFQGLGSTCICNIPGDNGQPMIRW